MVTGPRPEHMEISTTGNRLREMAPMEDANVGRTPGELFGENSNARFAPREKIKFGTPLLVFLRSTDPPAFYPAIATGRKNKRNEHVVRIVKGGRKWDFGAKNRDILVRW